MVKLIMFDLDGTLVDSARDITNALNYAVEPYGIEPLTVERTVGMVGGGLTKLMQTLLGPDRADIMPEVLIRFLEYYSAHLADFTAPYPGVPETLQRLSAFKKAVISNKREALSRKVLEILGLAGHFAIILGSDSVEEKKPSPKPLFLIMDRLGLAPSEALMVGDSIYDIQAGKAAGVRTVAVSYGYREKESLSSADYLIDHMDELPAVIENINAGEG